MTPTEQQARELLVRHVVKNYADEGGTVQNVSYMEQEIIRALLEAEASGAEQAANIVQVESDYWHQAPTSDEETRVLYQRLGNVLHHASEKCHQHAQRVWKDKP